MVQQLKMFFATQIFWISYLGLISAQSCADHSTDIICNNGTMDSGIFACVCYQADQINDTDNFTNTCYSLISDKTPSLKLTLAANGGTTLALLTKETIALGGRKISYEYYFKRRVSSIVSKYCLENQCKLISDVTPANIIILRLSCGDKDPGNIVMYYTVLKSAQSLDDASAVDPQLILSALTPKLQKTIPYKIVDHQVHVAKASEADSSVINDEDDENWLSLWKRNLGFVIPLIVILILLTVIYVVAILKAIRDRSRRQAANRKLNSGQNAKKSSGYGATEEVAKPKKAKNQFLTTIPEKDEPTETQRKKSSEKVAETNDDEKFTKNGINQNRSTDKLISDPTTPVPKNGFGFFIQPSSAEKSGDSLDYELITNTDNTDKFYPPPEPIDSNFLSPEKRSTSFNLNQPRKEKIVKKAATMENLDSIATESYHISTAPVTPSSEPEEILDSDGSYRSRKSTVIKVPVLIVPAMTNHLNDKDYQSDKKFLDENVISDKRTGRKSPDFDASNQSGKSMRSALSEESLLPRDQQISSFSSDAGTPDVDGNEGVGNFRLLTSGIGYQPLRESDWSVNKTNPNEETAEENYDESIL